MTERETLEHTKATSNGIGDYLRNFIFQQDNVQKPDLDLSDPSQYDVETPHHTSFFIPSPPGEIGAWYLQPKGETTNKVILYLHGVKGTRGRSHRVALYNLLLREGYEILTIDYRGFGDSSDVSETEDTVVQDARAALGWVCDKVGDQKKIFVWGHSMGTGVACHAVAEEFIKNGCDTKIAGLVLEAPYNNFTEELIEHTSKTDNPVAKTALKTLYSSTGEVLPEILLKLFNMEFNSDEWLPNVMCPVMILHSKGDVKIPIKLAEKLLESGKRAGKENIEFHTFEEEFEHHDIHKAPELPSLVRNFIEKEQGFEETRVVKAATNPTLEMDSDIQKKSFFKDVSIAYIVGLLAILAFLHPWMVSSS